MKDNRMNFWITWLKIASIIVVIFGIFMAISSVIAKDEPSPIDIQMNKSFFKESSELTKSMMDFQSWQYGVGSSMLISWGILMFFLTSAFLSEKKIKAWFSMITALISWFIIDETISLLYRVTFNVIFNIIFLLIFLIPLLLLKIEFSNK